jgi:molybdopterin/thiamine biosynthesis adenylyltransferase
MNNRGQLTLSNWNQVYKHELAIDSYWRVSYMAIMDCRVLVLGVGGFGTHVAFALTRMGVRQLDLIDRDIVEESNLPRHMLYFPKHVGSYKVEAAIETLRPSAWRTELCGHRFDVLDCRQETARLVAASDFVFTMFDSRGATLFATWLCHRANKPMVSGGVDQTTGFSLMWRFQQPGGKPCEECFARSTAIAPASWVQYHLSLDTRTAPVEVTDFNRRSSCSPDSPIVFPSASVGAMEMVNVFLRHRMGKEQPAQVRVNTMDQQRLMARSNVWWKDCPLCGTDR